MTTHPTQDDAIAAALIESAPGEQVVVHDVACASRAARDNADAERLCSCRPLVLTVGARA